VFLRIGGETVYQRGPKRGRGGGGEVPEEVEEGEHKGVRGEKRDYYCLQTDGKTPSKS